MLVVYRCTQVAAGPECLLIVYYTGAPKGQQGLAAGPDYLLVVYRCTQGAAGSDCLLPDCLLIVYAAAVLRNPKPGETLNSEKP